jgi:Na+/proline symporter
MEKPEVARPPITDSPWYWLYLFATFALVALFVMSPKFYARQAQIERNSQARQRAVQQRVGEEPSAPLSDEAHTTISLWPLYTIMSMLLLAGWIGLWHRHRSNSLPVQEKDGAEV